MQAHTHIHTSTTLYPSNSLHIFHTTNHRGPNTDRVGFKTPKSSSSCPTSVTFSWDSVHVNTAGPHWLHPRGTLPLIWAGNLMFSRCFFFPSGFHLPLVLRTRKQVSNLLGSLSPWSNPELSHGTRWLLMLVFPLSFQPMGPQDPFLLHFFFPLLHLLYPNAVTHDFLHILQHHLPLAAIPKPGSFRCDSFLPLLLDIQSGGQRALSEIPEWGGTSEDCQISS